MCTYTCRNEARDGITDGAAASAVLRLIVARRFAGISETGGATSAPPSETFTETGPAIPPPAVPEVPVDEEPPPQAAKAAAINRVNSRHTLLRNVPAGVFMFPSSSMMSFDMFVRLS
jgi:hypothetical protein